MDGSGCQRAPYATQNRVVIVDGDSRGCPHLAPDRLIYPDQDISKVQLARYIREHRRLDRASNVRTVLLSFASLSRGNLQSLPLLLSEVPPVWRDACGPLSQGLHSQRRGSPSWRAPHQFV